MTRPTVAHWGSRLNRLRAAVLGANDGIVSTAGLVVGALALTGWSSARLGAAAPPRAVLRNVAGGAPAMRVTYLAGALLDVAGV